jgi:SAM-dependent methyltransferase
LDIFGLLRNKARKAVKYAAPVHVDELEQCKFYHTFDLPTIGLVKGQWDLREKTDNYLGNMDFKGKTCLDVGAASGFLSFEMEKRGGIVTSFDADDASRFSFLPFKDSLYMTDRELKFKHVNKWLNKLKNSYWLAHRLLRSNAKVFYGDVYNIPTELGRFDIVMVGQIMIHLRDPVLALTSISNVCNNTLIISEGMYDTDDTVAKFHARDVSKGPEWLWWQYSRGLWKEILAIMGFEVVNITTDKYACFHEYSPGEVEITTIVAKKKLGISPASKKEIVR